MNPQSIITPDNDDPLEIAEPFGRVKKWIDIVREENKYIFDSPLQCKTIRGSFLCIESNTLKDIGGFEVANCPYEDLDKSQGWGNISLNMFGYKVSRLFGDDSITYLSNF